MGIVACHIPLQYTRLIILASVKPNLDRCPRTLSKPAFLALIVCRSLVEKACVVKGVFRKRDWVSSILQCTETINIYSYNLPCADHCVFSLCVQEK